MKTTRKIINGKILLPILLLILLCVFAVSSNILANNNVAYASSNQFTIIEGMYDNYTDTDYLLNSSKKITSYPNDSTLYRGTSEIFRNNGEFVLSVSGDDAIVQIVPKELFYHIGEHLYIGKEYGFFVKTEAEKYDYKDGNNNWQSTTSNYNRKSTVLVFDITTQDNFVETIDRFIVSVSPIFQFEYAFIDSGQTYFALASNSNKDRYDKQVFYSINTSSVIPIGPVNAFNNVIYGQVEKYYLKDISFSTRLLNEQAPNDTLPSNYYNPSDDNGAFFTSYDYSYNGIVREEGDFPIGKTVMLGLDTVSYLLGTASTVLSIVCPPAALVSAGLGVAAIATGTPGFIHNLGSGIIDIVNRATPSNVEISSGNITVTPLFTTKPHQIKEYDRLIKQATIFVNTGSDESIWYNNGSNATAYFTIANSAPDLHSEYQTRIIREIGVKVIDENDNFQAIGLSSYHYINGDTVEEILQLEENDTTYLLPNGNNYFNFYAQYTSNYRIYIDTTEVISLKVNGNVIPRSSDNCFYIKLYAGSNNSIQVSNVFSHIVAPIAIEPNSSLSNLNIDPNSEYLIRYNLGTNNLYTLVSSAGIISNICLLSDTGVLSRLELLDDYKEKASVDVYLKTNKIYYVVLKNSSTSTSIVSNLSLNQLSHTLALGDNSSRTISAQNNFVYYKFIVPTGTISDYVFLFSGITNITDIFNFRIMDSNGSVCSIIQYSYGYLKGLSLAPGATYYIGIKSNAAKSPAVTIQRNEATYKWKVLQGSTTVKYDSMNTVELTRGYAYKFELWLNDAVKVRTIHIATDTSNGIGLSNINNLTGYITITSDRKDGTSFTLVGLYEDNPDLSYSLGLLVKVLFNPNDITFNSIDYYNAIKINWPSRTDLVNVSYKISGTNEQGNTFSYTGSTSNLYVDCLSSLISLKALSNVQFTITSATIRTGDLNATRSVSMDKSILINCMYSRYEKKTVLLIFTTHYYYVSNALQVYNIRHNMSYNRYLDTDINMNFYSSWIPIPTLNCNIYGQNYTLTNLKITVPSSPSSESYYGFVGINNAYISGLKIQNATISSTSGSHEKPWVNVGAIAGYNANGATIYNCSATGTINVHHNNSRVGGLVGHNLGTISYSNFGSMSENQSLVNGNGDMAGIAGQSNGTVTYCNVYNSRVHSYIVAYNRSSGGIVGYNYGGTLSYCNVYAVEIAFTGFGNMSSSALKPNMGIIVGHIENSNLHYVGRDNAGVNTGSLTSQQAANCANGPWGVYGIAVNTDVK